MIYTNTKPNQTYCHGNEGSLYRKRYRYTTMQSTKSVIIVEKKFFLNVTITTLGFINQIKAVSGLRNYYRSKMVIRV